MACEATIPRHLDSLHFSHLVLSDIALKITSVINHGSYIIGLSAPVKKSLALLKMSLPLQLVKSKSAEFMTGFNIYFLID